MANVQQANSIQAPAFNMRVIPTHIPAYTNKKYYRSVYNGGKYFLDKWGVVLLRVEDRYQLSRTRTLTEPASNPTVAPPQRKAA